MNPIALELHRLAAKLDRPLPLAESILDLLGAGPLSGTDVAVVLRKRYNLVLSTCKELHASGRIHRVGHRWALQIKEIES